MNSRIDEFAGTTTDYVLYLEQEILHLRQELLTRPINTGEHCSSNSAASREPRELPEDTRDSSLARLGTESPQIATRSQIYKNSKDSQRDHTRFEHYNPLRKPGRPKWEHHAEKLVRKTPVATQWEMAFREVDMYTIMADGSAATFLLDAKLSVPTLSAENDLQPRMDGLAGLLQQYAHSVSVRDVTARIASRVANFQKFLLFSACAVLKKEKLVLTDTIYDILKISLGNVKTRYCQRTLDTAVYLNRLIDSLDYCGWINRAAELILLWNEKPSYFYPLCCSAEKSIKYLNEHLTAPNYISEEQARWTPLFVPVLVYQVLEGKVNLQLISHALGYKHSSELFAINPLQVLR